MQKKTKKTTQKPNPSAGSCRVQLVTRDRGSPRGLLIPHMWHYLSGVDLGDFMRVWQLLWLVMLGPETVKVRRSPSVSDCAATSRAISRMCLGLSALGRQGSERKSVTSSPLCL